MMEITVCHVKSGKTAAVVSGLSASNTIEDVKNEVHKQKSSLPAYKQGIKMDVRGKALKDTDTLGSLKLASGDKLYVKDLGPQVGWATVFLCEYAGPLVLYAWIYTRPFIFYGQNAAIKPYSLCTHIALGCWVAHYAKRLLETIFVHRFSHATMPLMNLFKNCSYYWGFAAYVAYHVNHPLFTAPSSLQVNIGLALFTICEVGNLSIHVLLRNLRPAGSKERRIPHPTSNPLTSLQAFVSCPNYTYEFGAWLSFTIMTQCLPAGLFTLCGVYQMTVWALGKHRNYKKEFTTYPKGRKAIIPFLI